MVCDSLCIYRPGHSYYREENQRGERTDAPSWTNWCRYLPYLAHFGPGAYTGNLCPSLRYTFGGHPGGTVYQRSTGSHSPAYARLVSRPWGDYHLGANVVSMAVVGSFVAFGTFLLFRGFNAPVAIAAFSAGLFGNLATYITTSFQLASALHGPGIAWDMFWRPMVAYACVYCQPQLPQAEGIWDMFWAIIVAFAPIQGPVAVVEGLITASVILVVHRYRPEILSHIMFRGKNRRDKTE